VAFIKKREGSKKPWQVRYRDHTGKDRSEQFTRKADADARLREVQTLEETGKIDLLDAGKTTLAEVAVQFFQLNRREWKDNTAKQHAYLWNSVMEGEGDYSRPAIVDMPVRGIRTSHVASWRNDALDAGVPFSSVQRVLWLITRALDHAAEDDVIPANPAARVKMPANARPPKAKPSIITPEQVEQIRAQMTDERDRVMVSIFAYCGLRPHELRALKVGAFAGDTLHLEYGCAEDGSLQPLKAGHEMRDVPICDAVRADVKAAKWGRRGAWMFPNVHGNAWTKNDWDNWRNRRFKKAVIKANAKLTEDAKKVDPKADPVLIPADVVPYDLRASAASGWYRQGIDKATIASWLGHSVKVLEDHYVAHFKTLDALDRRTLDQLIEDARRKR